MEHYKTSLIVVCISRDRLLHACYKGVRTLIKCNVTFRKRSLFICTNYVIVNYSIRYM